MHQRGHLQVKQVVERDGVGPEPQVSRLRRPSSRARQADVSDKTAEREAFAGATEGSGKMKQALAHARAHCAPTYRQVGIMPSRLTSACTPRLRGHRAAYGFAEHLELRQCTRRRAAKGPGGSTHADLSQMAEFRLARKTSLGAETSSAPKVMPGDAMTQSFSE